MEDIYRLLQLSSRGSDCGRKNILLSWWTEPRSPEHGKYQTDNETDGRAGSGIAL